MIGMGVVRLLCGNILLQRNTTTQVVCVTSAISTLRKLPTLPGPRLLSISLSSHGCILNSRWSSWLITAHKDLTSSSDKPDPRLATFLSGVTKGIEYFHSHIDEGIEYIAANLGYTAQDARDWLKTVEHVKDASKVERSMIENTVEILSKAGVVKGEVGVNDLVVKEAL